MGCQQTRWHPQETAGRGQAGGAGLAGADPAGGGPGQHGGRLCEPRERAAASRRRHSSMGALDLRCWREVGREPIQVRQSRGRLVFGNGRKPAAEIGSGQSLRHHRHWTGACPGDRHSAGGNPLALPQAAVAAAGCCDRRIGGLPGGPPGPWRGVGRMRLKRPQGCGAPARATVPASCQNRPLLQLKHKPMIVTAYQQISHLSTTRLIAMPASSLEEQKPSFANGLI